MFAIEYIHPKQLRGGVDENDVPWTRLDDCFDTQGEADEFILLLEMDGYGHRYRVVPWDAANDNAEEEP